MKKSIIIYIALFISIISYARTDEFFLSFEVLEKESQAGTIKAWVTLEREDIIIQEKTVGDIMPLYNPAKKNKTTYFGKVTLDKKSRLYQEMGGQILLIELDESPDNMDLLNNNKALIRITAEMKDVVDYSVVYDMIRLNVGMVDVYGEKNLLALRTREQMNFKFHKSALKIMDDEADFVAGEMRGQMDEPEVTEGRFKHHGLFTAMEMACEEDVQSFLIYVKEYPFKYQGTTWKFSEIFATWIVEGTPSVRYDLENLASTDWGIDFFFLRFFIGVPKETTQTVLEHLREEAGHAIDKEDFELAEVLIRNAGLLAKDLNDLTEIAWVQYKKAKLHTATLKYEDAAGWYEQAFEHFQEHKVKTGILIVGNDMADNYNRLGGKSNYKKAIKSLEQAIEVASALPNDDDVLAPITGLMYQNMGNSYKSLGKFDDALSAYNKGLDYVKGNQVNALKRKATLLMNISELYQSEGQSSKADDYATQSVLTYREYETELAKVKNL